MKSIYLYISTLIIWILFVYNNSYAITYGWSSSFSLPDIVKSWTTLASSTFTSIYQAKEDPIDSSNTIHTFLWCVELENGMSWVTLMTFRNYSQASSWWPYWVWAELNIKIDQITSWTNSWNSLIYIEWYGLYSDDDVSRVWIAYVPSIHNSYLWDTSKWLFCFSPVIWQRNGWWVLDILDWLYIQNFSYAYFSWPTGRYWYANQWYSSLHYWLWIQIFKRTMAESSPPYWVNYTRLELYWNTSYNHKIYYNYDTNISWTNINDFIGSLSWSSIDQTIPQFLSMVSSTWSIVDVGGSWSIDYFWECWSFITDIVCYFDWIKSYFTDNFTLWEWDFIYSTWSLFSSWVSVSWTWTQNNRCIYPSLYEYSSFWGNFEIRSSLKPLDSFFWVVNNITYYVMSPFTSILSLFISVVPPSDWDKVCLLWTIYEVKYQKLFHPTSMTWQLFWPLEEYRIEPWEETLFDYVFLIFVGIIVLSITVYYLNLRST